MLISLGISALLFLGFHLATERLQWTSQLLLAWGKNPLVLYFFHYFLIGLFFLPGIPMLYAGAPVWVILPELVFLLGVISALALWMDRKRIIISI